MWAWFCFGVLGFGNVLPRGRKYLISFGRERELARKRVLDVVDTLVSILNTADEVVFEAYPGFGKTMLGAELVRRFRRGAMVVRTRAEVVVAMNMAEFLGYRLAPLFGRYSLCPLSEGEDPRTFPAFCRARRILGRCIEATESRYVEICSRLSTPEEIREASVREGVCLFKAHVIAALKNGRVVTTYEFLRHHPEVVDKLRTWDLVFLDECHALFEDVENLVVKVDRIFVYSLAEAMRSVDARLCYALKSLYRRWSSAEEVLETLARIGEECGERCPELLEVVDAWRRGRVYVQGEVIYVVKDPSISIGAKRVLTTAYIPPPLARGKKVVAVERSPMTIDVVIDTSISTRFRERGEDFIDRLSEAVAKHIDKNVATLVVAPSRAIAEELSKKLLSKGFRIAPPEAIDRVGEGTVVVEVAGGRATEGVTPSRSLRMVIVAGMPYPAPTPELNALSKVYGFESVYTYLALLRTVQALGRLMRWGGRAVLIDRRFHRYRDRFPKWVNVVGVE